MISERASKQLGFIRPALDMHNVELNLYKLSDLAIMIGKAGATFKSLGDAWADTTTPAGKLMLTVLGGLAEYERHLIL